METRLKLLGHPIHPMLIVFPLGLLSTAVVFDPAYLPNVLPMVIGLVGAGLALVTAWLGGELVFRLRVAVDEDAHLNAPSSLRASGVTEVEEGHIRT